MDWSIDVKGESPFEVGSLVLRVLRDRYLASVEDYDVSPEGTVSVVLRLPDDPWIRRTVRNWSRLDRDQIVRQRSNGIS